MSGGLARTRPRILCVFGTRPDTIKMAPVVRALAAASSWCDLRTVLTAQHRDLVDPLLGFFRIRPDHDLDLMRDNQSLAALTSRLFEALGAVLAEEQPDWVIVQGDTTTSLVAGMAAFYRGAAIGHVEAGLRTADPRTPFPEEMNRRLLGRLADLHFAPTSRAADALRAEQVPADRIVVTGNTAIDALRWASGEVREEEWRHLLPPSPATRLVVVTTHRRESFGPPLEQICQSIAVLARHYGDGVQVVLPVHPNPNVRHRVHAVLDGIPNVRLLPPLSYPALVFLLTRAHLVLTDSGGLQEEAPSLGIPVLVLREETERPEAVAAGVTRIVGTNADTIVAEARRLLDDAGEYARRAKAVDVYGDGEAAARIVSALKARVDGPPARRVAGGS